jgi:hypothetical protein
VKATLQLDALKTLLKEQYGVPEGIIDQIDSLYRLTYREAWQDCEEAAVRQLEEDRIEKEL